MSNVSSFDKKIKSSLKYTKPMLKSISEPEPVYLEVKVFGEPTLAEFHSISDALERAIEIIQSGSGIPKRIIVGGKQIMSEADINKEWELSLDGKEG
jgi:hypothetical protein